MLWTSKEEKERLVQENKVVFQEGHPVWSVKGIPDPTWEDIKWAMKAGKTLQSKEKFTITLFELIKEKKFWRLAKLLEMRRELPEDERPSTVSRRYWRTPSDFAMNQRSLRTYADIIIPLLFNNDGANRGSYTNNAISLLIEEGRFTAVIEYYNHNLLTVYEKRELLFALTESHEKPETVDRLYEDLLKNDRPNLINFVIKSLDTQPAFKLTPLLARDDKILDETLETLLMRRSLKTAKKVADSLIDLGAGPQKCLENCRALLCDDKIAYLMGEKIVSVSKASKAKIKTSVEAEVATRSQVNETWEYLSEQKISHTIRQIDGSSLKYIFDFAAKSVKTIERVPGEMPASFENKFHEVGSADLGQAADELTARNGQPNYTVKTADTAKPMKA